MRTTIGELTNELMHYSRMIEMNMNGDTPFIKALLGSNSGFTKGYFYVVQTAEHQYSTCDHYDELHGTRVFPTQNIYDPFIVESNFIQSWLKRLNEIKEGEWGRPVSGLNHSDFLDHFYDLLFQYKIIRVNPNIFNTDIADLKFSSRKISKNIETIFKPYKFNSPKIKDLITIVKKNFNTIHLGNLKPKDINELESKFKQIGIILNIKNNSIIDLQFEKKELRRVKYSS